MIFIAQLCSLSERGLAQGKLEKDLNFVAVQVSVVYGQEIDISPTKGDAYALSKGNTTPDGRQVWG